MAAGRLEHLNPAATYDSLGSRGYTQVVKVETPGTWIYLAGQLPLDKDGKVVGAGDIAAQARAVFENIRLSLAAAGAGLEHVVKLTTFVTDITTHPGPVRRVRAEYFGKKSPPASTMVEVPRFALPEILIEIDAVAVVP